MNIKIGMAGSLINCFSVAIFAVTMLIRFDFGNFFICMILAIGFVMMIASLAQECESSFKCRIDFHSDLCHPHFYCLFCSNYVIAP